MSEQARVFGRISIDELHEKLFPADIRNEAALSENQKKLLTIFYGFGIDFLNNRPEGGVTFELLRAIAEDILKFPDEKKLSFLKRPVKIDEITAEYLSGVVTDLLKGEFSNIRKWKEQESNPNPRNIIPFSSFGKFCQGCGYTSWIITRMRNILEVSESEIFLYVDEKNKYFLRRDNVIKYITSPKETHRESATDLVPKVGKLGQDLMRDFLAWYDQNAAKTP